MQKILKMTLAYLFFLTQNICDAHQQTSVQERSVSIIFNRGEIVYSQRPPIGPSLKLRDVLNHAAFKNHPRHNDMRHYLSSHKLAGEFQNLVFLVRSGKMKVYVMNEKFINDVELFWGDMLLVYPALFNVKDYKIEKM